jgi:spermidine synthase
VDLVDCHKKNICKLEEKEFYTLIESALNNQTIGGKRKAAALFAWTDYLANVKHDLEEATKFAKLTSNEFPSFLQYRLNYIYFLIAQSDFDEAKRELELARKLDTNNSYYNKIRQIHNIVITRLPNQ